MWSSYSNTLDQQIFAEDSVIAESQTVNIDISVLPLSLGTGNSYQSLRPNLHLNCWPTPSSIIRQHSWILSREIIFPACWRSGLWDPLIHISRISANRKIILYRYLTSGPTDWKSFKTSENDLCDNSQSFFQLPVWRRKREVDFISDFPFCKN